MKVETLEQFLARGGKVNKGDTPEYKFNGKWRYRMKDTCSHRYFVPPQNQAIQLTKGKSNGKKESK